MKLIQHNSKFLEKPKSCKDVNASDYPITYNIPTHNDLNNYSSLSSHEKEIFNQSYSICINYLSRREYSKIELKKILYNKGISCIKSIDCCVSFLSYKKIQSDYRFADMIFSARVNQKYGANRIKQELRFKGIDDSIIAEFVDEKDNIWLKNVLLLVHKKVKLDTFLLDDMKKVEKLKRYLASRGYSFEIIMKSIKEYKNNEYL